MNCLRVDIFAVILPFTVIKRHTLQSMPLLMDTTAAVARWISFDLTSRCSQPLALAMRQFNFMKELSILAKLALASGS